MRCSLVLLGLYLGLSWAAPDPTNYEFYTSGGIKSGLSAATDQFALNGKQIVLYSGSFHYFRVVPEYWKQTLARFRAAGLNTVQLYLPWNLHEETKGKFDFTSNHLNLDKFLEEIKAADMFAIVRIGPYICAEWDFGGFPAWLYRDPNVVIRSNNKPYLDAVASYWTEVMKIVNKHTFSDKGGPIIMLQIENEFYRSHFNFSVEYLNYLHDFVMRTGFKELLFTSDPAADQYPIKNVFPHHDVLETLNGNHGLGQKLLTLKTKQVNRPGFVSEFWPGWFDAWGRTRHARYAMYYFELELNDILFKANSSVNFYMFIGGTNFGFTNGGRVVTSYDYDAPLSESGNYTAKYHKTREFYQKLVTAGKLPKTHLPEVPPVQKATVYPKIAPKRFLQLEQLLAVARKFENIHKPVTMELLPVGQNFGFVLYRAESKEVKNYEVTSPIHDRALFLVDGVEVFTIEEKDPLEQHFNHTFTATFKHSAPTHKYDLLVENQGRANYGDAMLHQQKGVSADIKLDDQVWHNFTVYSLDFKQDYVAKLHTLSSWHPIADLNQNQTAPAFYSSVLTIDHEPMDTFVSLPGWTKGNLFVNGFNLGRYWSVGPTKTLYLPAPLLRKGANVIDVFELHKPGTEIHFLDQPQLE